MAPGDVLRLGHAQPVEIAAFELVAVARHVHIIKIKRKAQEWQQLAGKHHCAAHHRQQKRIFAAQIGADFVGQALERGAAFGFAEQ